MIMSPYSPSRHQHQVVSSTGAAVMMRITHKKMHLKDHVRIELECVHLITIGPLHDPVTWYGINYTGTQITQWDFQNKGKLGWTGASSFVLEVLLHNLRPSVIYSVPCDRIVQRAYYMDAKGVLTTFFL